MSVSTSSESSLQENKTKDETNQMTTKTSKVCFPVLPISPYTFHNVSVLSLSKLLTSKSIITEKTLIIEQPEELKDYNVECYYIKNFLSETEADVAFEQLMEKFPFHQEQVSIFGKTHDQPRLTRFMG